MHSSETLVRASGMAPACLNSAIASASSVALISRLLWSPEVWIMSGRNIQFCCIRLFGLNTSRTIRNQEVIINTFKHSLLPTFNSNTVFGSKRHPEKRLLLLEHILWNRAIFNDLIHLLCIFPGIIETISHHTIQNGVDFLYALNERIYHLQTCYL